MTAEVAILNKQSVAMAADSAVTTGDDKIFNTVNKLFALSKHEPVGIMVYSSAEIMGVPVETVVKEFRRATGRESCDHLEDYAAKFDEFLRTDNTLFDEAARVRSFASCAWEIADRLKNIAYHCLNESIRKLPSWDHPTKAECKSALLEALSGLEEHLKECPSIKVDRGSTLKRTLTATMEPQHDHIVKWLGQAFPIDSSASKRIKKVLVDQLFKDCDGAGETGIVIAGFGKKDIFPRLRNIEFVCSGLGLHKAPGRATFDIAAHPVDKIAAILPFAQGDVMATFVGGRHPMYERALMGFISGFFDERATQLRTVSPPQPTNADLVTSLGAALLGEIDQRLEQFSQEAFITPTIQVVASMPKEELAILAEALVNLTALKRKASRDAETVGGPTDVAVISKGDGFVWIKRKHYFESKYNPGFTARYLEEA